MGTPARASCAPRCCSESLTSGSARTGTSWRRRPHSASRTSLGALTEPPPSCLAGDARTLPRRRRLAGAHGARAAGTSAAGRRARRPARALCDRGAAAGRGAPYGRASESDDPFVAAAAARHLIDHDFEPCDEEAPGGKPMRFELPKPQAALCGARQAAAAPLSRYRVRFCSCAGGA